MTVINHTIIRELTSAEVSRMRDMINMFGHAFFDNENRINDEPSDEYINELLSSKMFIAVVAEIKDKVVGGLTAYELRKYKKQASEIYLYDLAVLDSYRRQGIGMALIIELQKISSDRGAEAIFVQADVEDVPAISLYTKFSTGRDVFHFDIPIK